MDIDSVLATGGVGGATGIIIFIVYKLLRMGFKSKCCGYSVEIGLQTPKNISIVDDQTQSHSRSQDGNSQHQRPTRSSISENQGGISSERSSSTQGNCGPRDHFERTNPLTIVVP